MAEAGPSRQRLSSLRAGPVCFDTTVPRHLARTGAAGEVLSAFAGRVRWPSAVAIELRRAKSRVPGIGQLLRLGAEVELDAAQEAEAEDLRRESLTEEEIRTHLTKNRGEAECVVLCAAEGWPLVVHDETGIAWAVRRGVAVFSVVDVLLVCAAEGHLEPRKAWRIYERLCEPMFHADPDRAGMFAVPGWSPGAVADRDRFLRLAAELR